MIVVDCLVKQRSASWIFRSRQLFFRFFRYEPLRFRQRTAWNRVVHGRDFCLKDTDICHFFFVYSSLRINTNSLPNNLGVLLGRLWFSGLENIHPTDVPRVLLEPHVLVSQVLLVAAKISTSSSSSTPRELNTFDYDSSDSSQNSISRKLPYYFKLWRKALERIFFAESCKLIRVNTRPRINLWNARYWFSLKLIQSKRSASCTVQPVYRIADYSNKINLFRDVACNFRINETVARKGTTNYFLCKYQTLLQIILFGKVTQINNGHRKLAVEKFEDCIL